MGVDRRGLEIGMVQRRGDQRNGRAIVDGVGGVGVPEPMHGSSGVDARVPGRGLDDEVDGPVGQDMARVADRLEHGSRGRRIKRAIRL